MFDKTVLPNGLRIVSSSLPHTRSVSISIFIGAGSRYESDDIAGVSDLYPDGGLNDTTGSLSGRVTRNGVGVFGAHVVAFDPGNGSLVGTFSLDNQGRFAILGLSPGPHIIRVEPLDDADVDSFFGSTQTVDLDFRVTFVDRLVVVPRGGSTGTIELKVVPK